MAAGAASVPTPSTITQLYRLVLRYAAASVLYSKPASQNLKRLYRPEFDIWMGRVQRASKTERLVHDRAEWEEFARRVQKTLNLLHRSSTTRDVTHKLTSNLADMQYHMDPVASVAARTSRSGTPSVPMSRPEFLPGKARNRSSEVDKLHAWDAFAELVGMAEGSSGVLLGKLRPKSPAPSEGKRRTAVRDS